MREGAVASAPDAGVDAGGRDPAGGDVEDGRRLAVDRVAGMDGKRVELEGGAPDADVAAAVDHEAGIAPQPLGQEIGGQSLAAAAGVKANPGRAPDRPGLVVDLDQPPRRVGMRSCGRRSGASARASASGTGSTPARDSE